MELLAALPVKAAIPARAHSSSCAWDEAPSTPHPPSIRPSRKIGNPPRTRYSGKPSPITSSTGAGDVAVIPRDIEHEGFFPEDTEVVDVFSPPREDFLAGGTPSFARADDRLPVASLGRVQGGDGIVEG